MPSEIRLALEYLEHEMDARLMPPAKQPIRLDQPSGRAISEAEKAALRKVFGTEQALDIRRLPGKGPQASYSIHIPGHAIGAGDERSEWQELNAHYSFDASGKRYNASGMWPGIRVQDKDNTLTLGTVHYRAQVARDISGMWLGKTHADVDHAAIQSRTSPISVRWEQITVDNSSKRQGKNIEVFAEGGAKRMHIGDTSIELPHFAVNLRGMDADTLKAFRDEAQKLRHGELPGKEADAVALQMSLGRLKNLALKGASFDISDFSGVYQGARLQIKGRLSAPGLNEADLASADLVLDKLDGQLDVSLPQPILHAIARGIARIGNDKAGKEQLREQDMYDIMIGKLIGSGYARMEKDKLVARLQIKRGMLRITDSKELIPLKTLLKALDEHDKEDAPPEDHSTPVPVTWRDRSLENVRLFAGNGEEDAIDELCYRYTKGDHAAKDSAEAEHWCQLSKHHNGPEWEQGPSKEPAIFEISQPPGYYEARFARFDETKSRRLDLTLSKPGQHEKWLPMMSLCLQAEAPSARACVQFSQTDLTQPELAATVTLLATDAKSEKRGQSIRVTPDDGTVHVQVFVLGQKAHFLINEKEELVQDIVFPVELIQMTCSTADCRFKFN